MKLYTSCAALFLFLASFSLCMKNTHDRSITLPELWLHVYGNDSNYVMNSYNLCNGDKKKLCTLSTCTSMQLNLHELWDSSDTNSPAISIEILRGARRLWHAYNLNLYLKENEIKIYLDKAEDVCTTKVGELSETCWQCREEKTISFTNGLPLITVYLNLSNANKQDRECITYTDSISKKKQRKEYVCF